MNLLDRHGWLLLRLVGRWWYVSDVSGQRVLRVGRCQLWLLRSIGWCQRLLRGLSDLRVGRCQVRLLSWCQLWLLVVDGVT